MWDNQTLTIVIIAIVIFVIIVLALGFSSNGDMNETMMNVEHFHTYPYQSSNELDSYFAGPNADIKDYLVDNLTCHPDCCGDQMPSLDGMTGAELEDCLRNPYPRGPYIRT